MSTTPTVTPTQYRIQHKIYTHTYKDIQMKRWRMIGVWADYLSWSTLNMVTCQREGKKHHLAPAQEVMGSDVTVLYNTILYMCHSSYYNTQYCVKDLKLIWSRCVFFLSKLCLICVNKSGFKLFLLYCNIWSLNGTKTVHEQEQSVSTTLYWYSLNWKSKVKIWVKIWI